MDRLAVLVTVAATAHLARYWLFLRAVERYRDRGAAHADVVAFADAIRLRRAPP